jgi:hypothetical protein
MRYNTLGIHVTNTCNMTCTHCITDSSPSARGDLSWADIAAAVRSAAPHVDGVCVTGGEPLLRPKMTYRTIRLTRDLGLVASLITNGFWARSDAKTRKVFSNLVSAGLTKMGVSFDGYHTKHERLVTQESLERLLRIGLATGIPIKVQYCGNQDDDAYQVIENLTHRYQIPLVASKVLPFGRGWQIAVRRHSDVAKVQDIACGVVVRPVLTPEGDLYTCCGPARGAHRDSPLRLQPRTAAGVGDALRGAASDPILNFIHTQGPVALYNRLDEATRQRVSQHLLDESFCSLCRAITDDTAAVQQLRDVLADERFVLIAASGFMQLNGPVPV